MKKSYLYKEKKKLILRAQANTHFVGNPYDVKLVGIIGEALPEHAQLGPALYMGIVPIKCYRRGSLVHGIFWFV